MKMNKGVDLLLAVFTYTVAAISGFNVFPQLLQVRTAKNDAYPSTHRTTQATPEIHIDTGRLSSKDTAETPREQTKVSHVEVNQNHEPQASTSNTKLEEGDKESKIVAILASESTAEINNALKEYIAERIAMDMLLANRRQGLPIQYQDDATHHSEHILKHESVSNAFVGIQDFHNRFIWPLLEDEMFFADFGLLVFSWAAIILFRFAPKLLQNYTRKNNKLGLVRTCHSLPTRVLSTPTSLDSIGAYATSMSSLSNCEVATSSIDLISSSTPAPKPDSSLDLAPATWLNSSEVMTSDESMLSEPGLPPSSLAKRRTSMSLHTGKEVHSPPHCPSPAHIFFSDPVTSKFKVYVPPHRRLSRQPARLEDDSPCANRRAWMQPRFNGECSRKISTSFSATLQGNQSDSDSESDDFIFPLSADAVENWRQRDPNYPMRTMAPLEDTVKTKYHRRTTSADYSMVSLAGQLKYYIVVS